MTTSTPLTTPEIACQYLPEPLLAFRDGGLHVDPKAGIARYGPRSLGTPRHPSHVRVGFVGTADTIQKTWGWLEENARGVRGDEKHPDFPGYAPDRGFFSELETIEYPVGKITQTELLETLKIRGARERFERAVELLDEKVRLLSEQDQPPQYVMVGLPNDLINRCRTADYADHEVSMVHRDLRRAFKVMAMKYWLPTQLMRQPTAEGKDRDDPSKIAWNFFTGLYFKAGGVPWAPTSISPGTCYVGISFYRPLGSKRNTLQTSLVQAFDDRGEGLVLRGHDFEWDPEKEGSRSPHLTEEHAHGLIEMVLGRYRQEVGQVPRRVVVHKGSTYWPAEREGFAAALAVHVGQYDLVALRPQSATRLITESKYPPLRGTRFGVGEMDFLYTEGFIAELGEFHALHVPSPLEISDHVGQDTSRETLLREILLLTKMNHNSARFGGLLPISLKFSRLMGEILREIPADRDPLPQFKFYM